VNPAITLLLGYSPEQLLCQDLSLILPPNRCQIFFSQLSLMKEGQSALFFDDHVEALADNENLIPVHSIIFGIAEENDQANSFVVILRDESILQKQMNQAQAAKD
jgi:PAS domain-containing protein